ncbi:MAG: hypothetical protein HN507_09935 [Flavobacteriaceae bacterium]|nr:hypothetical protein [Flavobacteriaceae bacterium]
MKINVGFLVAYDYDLLKISIPLIYENATKIVLALDKNYQTWSGNYFKVGDSFFEWIEQIDINKKIIIYKDVFYLPENTAIQNDTRERNLLAKEMGEGFCIQLDADEFVLDFKEMVTFLNKHEKKLSGTKKYQVCAYLNDVYKETENGFLFVKEVSPFYMGTNQPNFVRARKNKNQQKWYIPFAVIHLTWGRSAEELKFKLENWGHNIDFDTKKYFDFWNSINEINYKDHKCFHPFNSKSWKELHFIEGKNIIDIIKTNNITELIPNTKRKLKNLAQTFKHLI